MPVLEKYRARGSRPGSGYRRAIIFGAMLLVVGALFLSLNRASRKGAPPPPAPPAPPAATSRDVDDAQAGSMPDQWKPLPPAEERTLLAALTDQQPLYVREHREAYYYLLNKAHHMTDSALDSQVNNEITYADYGRQPDIVRGSVVEVTGRLLRLNKTMLQPGKATIPAVYEGQILDRDNHVYSFFLTEPPGPPFRPGAVRISDGIGARLRGIFMQVLAYDNRENPPKTIVSPLLIGRRLIEISAPDTAPAPLAWYWYALITVGAVVLGTWLVWTTRVTRRPTRA